MGEQNFGCNNLISGGRIKFRLQSFDFGCGIKFRWQSKNLISDGRVKFRLQSLIDFGWGNKISVVIINDFGSGIKVRLQSLDFGWEINISDFGWG